ncbi:MAG: Asp-tRNA(Asn)/Glu-tRNA(Gln) amidotransferase subunit GatB [Gemmatimonadota bacterium]
MSAGTIGTDGWEAVIGIEVHVQLRTRTKMFCGCLAEYGAAPNSRVCPVCLGLPGALPVPNEQAVRLGVRAALALGCSIHANSRFDRKNYFYPDLPKGYQITQFDWPVATNGSVRIRSGDEERSIGVRRLHLEEDAGKSQHDRFDGSTAVDLNRAGVPLAEIVTEPDLRSPGEARAYLTRLKQLLEHFAAVSDCNMEEGSLRADANLSVRRVGSTALGTKTEVKNLNSFAHVEKALTYEFERQVAVLEAGDEVRHETRLYDPGASETRPMRGKEEATDYRYFPEPDLPLLEIDEAVIEEERDNLPELPDQLEARLQAQYELSEYDARLLGMTPLRAVYFESVVERTGAELAKSAANLIMGDLAAELNRRGANATEEQLMSPETLARIVSLRSEGMLSSGTASEALRLLIGEEAGQDPDDVVARHGLAQVQDDSQLLAWISEVVQAHPDESARFRGGEEKLIGFFMGAVMRASGGKADPGRTREALTGYLAAETEA